MPWRVDKNDKIAIHSFFCNHQTMTMHVDWWSHAVVGDCDWWRQNFEFNPSSPVQCCHCHVMSFSYTYVSSQGKPSDCVFCSLVVGER